jgi:cytoskeleton protein RodZ
LQKKPGQADKGNQTTDLGSSDTIGRYLRDLRLSRNISLEEVSELTGITTAVLQALENENREELPAEVYIKAFYKKYAQYLGVDSEEIQAKYLQKVPKMKKSGATSSFDTVITIKGQEENLFVEILRRLLLPLIIVILGLLCYWIYTNYLTSYNPFVFLQEHFPAVFSFFHENYSVFLS